MMDQYIYAISNSEDDFGQNTLTKFTHRLAKQLTLPKSENWGLCLHSFSCQNQTDSPAHLFKIVCEQVNSDTNTKKIISVHSRRPFSIGSDKRHFHSPKQKEYFPISHDTLDRISFELLDENNQRFPLTSGRPTWIVLHLKKMVGAFLPLRVSSEPTKDYPMNTPADFSVDLPAELGYAGQSHFEVALSSITMTPTFVQLPFFDKLNAGKIFVQVTDDKSGYKNKVFASAKFDPDKNFQCAEELIQRMINYLSLFKEQDKVFNDLFITTEYDTETGYVTFYPKNMEKHHRLKLYLPTPLAQQLGFRGADAEIKGHHTIVRLLPNFKAQGEFPVDMNFHIPQSAVVYSNFTRPALFGIGMSSVLKIVPLNISEKETGKYITIESEDLEWYGISFSSVNGLNFRLLGIDGEALQFLPGSSVYICLKLRLKQRDTILHIK